MIKLKEKVATLKLQLHGWINKYKLNYKWIKWGQNLKENVTQNLNIAFIWKYGYREIISQDY